MNSSLDRRARADRHMISFQMEVNLPMSMFHASGKEGGKHDTGLLLLLLSYIKQTKSENAVFAAKPLQMPLS